MNSAAIELIAEAHKWDHCRQSHGISNEIENDFFGFGFFHMKEVNEFTFIYGENEQIFRIFKWNLQFLMKRKFLLK